MSAEHPVDPPPEWAPSWDDSLREKPFRVGVLDALEAHMTTPGSRPQDGKSNAVTPSSPPPPRDGRAGSPADQQPSAPPGPAVPRLDFDALRPGDPNDSPFPPGSLGGGVEFPEPRVFPGFSQPSSTAAPAQPAATPPARPSATAAPSPAPRLSDPAPDRNPFRLYDERLATANLSLSAHDALPAFRGEFTNGPAAPLEAEPRLNSESLTADRVLRGQRKPNRRWRRGLHAATGGIFGAGVAARERRDAEFEARVRTPITNCHRIAVISLKGGVGKTTTVAALGSMFASLRPDRVIAVDANPDRGTLGDKIALDRSSATVRDFVRRSAELDRYSAVRAFTAQASSRLEVLASETDPLASTSFSEHDYRVITGVLERFYNLIVTDCGTGLLHSAMVGVLAKANQVMIVSSASLDGARSASATLDWLEAHSYGDLARESVTVITAVQPKAAKVDLDEIVEHFARRTRAVVAIPYDEHLAEGGQLDLRRLSRGTYQAFLQLAGEVADGFIVS